MKAPVIIIALAVLAAAPLPGSPLQDAAGALQAPRWIGLYDLQGKIGLRWLHAPGSGKVRIYRGLDAAPESFRLLAEVEGNDFIDLDVEPDVTYFYRLVAVDGRGVEGQPSIEKKLRTKLEFVRPLTAPSWEGFLLLDNGVGLKWQSRAGESVLAYNIYRREAGEERLALLSSTVESSYVDRTVERGRQYVYVLRALDMQFTESPPSGEMVVAMPAQDALPAPAAVKKWEMRRTSEVLMLQGGGGTDFLRPADIAVDTRARQVFVVDSGSRSILVFDLDGRYLRTFGPMSSHTWRNPLGISVDSEGLIYVVDGGGGTITVMSGNGVHQYVIDVSSRTDSGQTGIIDAVRRRDGRVFVVDNFNDRGLIVGRDAGFEVLGGQGSLPGSFSAPGFCTVDANGHLYVADILNARIQVFDSDGRFVRAFGERRQGPGGLGRPKGVAVSDSGEVFVADSWQNVIQVFDGEGRFAALLADEKGELLDLGSPNGIALDGRGRVWIAERLSGRVQVRQIVEN